LEAGDLVVIAAAVFAFALVSRRAEAGIVTAPMAFVLFGILVSPVALNWVQLTFRTEFVNGLAEVTLVLALFTDASRIDLRRLDSQHDLPLRLLSFGLPLTIAAGTGVALLLFPQLSLWEAGLLGVILAPTDAALGQAVVNNRLVPVRIRQALNVESGLNDGLVFPVLLVFLSLASPSTETRAASDWLVFVARQLLFGPLAGVIIGYLGAVAIERAAASRWMNKIFLRISVLAVALLAYGGADLIGGNGFIASFAAGLTVGTRSRVLLNALEDFGETEGQVLSLIVFLLFGLTMVPQVVNELDGTDILYAAVSLTVIRMLPVALSLSGTRLYPATTLFLGWFGPRGLASIIYLLLLFEPGDVAATGDLFTTVVVTVLISILAHGITAAPAARRYGQFMARLGEEGKRPEHRPVEPFPVRYPLREEQPKNDSRRGAESAKAGR
jgi:NhaP-type Na+/H+ or K+/H+ antiporter